jgi:hypothetical protein
MIFLRNASTQLPWYFLPLHHGTTDHRVLYELKLVFLTNGFEVPGDALNQGVPIFLSGRCCSRCLAWV